MIKLERCAILISLCNWFSFKYRIIVQGRGEYYTMNSIAQGQGEYYTVNSIVQGQGEYYTMNSSKVTNS